MEHPVRTIIDLIGLSPLLIDEDDGHQYDDLSHDSQEGPQGGPAAAHAQVDLVCSRADFIHSGANVVSDIAVDVQVVNGQTGPVRGALDLIFLAGSIYDGLKGEGLKPQGNHICVAVVTLYGFMCQL